MSQRTTKITIDGKEVSVPEGINLIEAAKLAGSSVPHYCYHSKLTVAGNCRICLVEIEKQPKLQIACNTKVSEGMVVKTQSPPVLEARQSVLEFILVNHPIDCPVCDQAGECKLQKYYMQHDLKPSRMEEEKVHKDKAIPLGPHVMLDMERCILCSRCIRFCKEVAEEDELCFSERGNHTELTTAPGKSLENPYSVNTVDICPVGALTSKDFRFKQRVWFLKETDSICPGCATGCNIKISHNKGVAYRLLPRTNDEVNECWMCDEGRMTYKSINTPDRLRSPILRLSTSAAHGKKKETRILRQEAVAAEFKKILENIPGSSILGIGSAQFTNESNAAFQRFLKETLGAYDIYYQALEVLNPSHDDFLIDADKNPNRAGVKALGMKPWNPQSVDHRYQAVLILGGMPFSGIEKFLLDKNSKVILFVSHDRPEWEYADLVLPVSLWAEEEGTFTNRQGRVQKIHAAFPPPGEALEVAGWIKFLALR